MTTSQEFNDSQGIGGRVRSSLALARTRVDQIEQRTRAHWVNIPNQLRDAVDGLLVRVRNTLDLPSRSEITDLIDRIEDIDAKLAGLEATRAATAPVPEAPATITGSGPEQRPTTAVAQPASTPKLTAEMPAAKPPAAKPPAAKKSATKTSSKQATAKTSATKTSSKQAAAKTPAAKASSKRAAAKKPAAKTSSKRAAKPAAANKTLRREAIKQAASKTTAKPRKPKR